MCIFCVLCSLYTFVVHDICSKLHVDFWSRVFPILKCAREAQYIHTLVFSNALQIGWQKETFFCSALFVLGEFLWCAYYIYFSNYKSVLSLQPYNHKQSVATYHYADKSLIEKAIGVALESRVSWESTPAEDRWGSQKTICQFVVCFWLPIILTNHPWFQPQIACTTHVVHMLF